MANSAPLIQIKFDGQRYSYWKHASIRESVDDLCASVQLGIALPPDGELPLKLTANTVIEVLIDNVLVTTIRAGKIRRAVSDTSHTVEIEARSLARELVDCQYSKTLKNLKLEEVVKRICETFKVPLKLVGTTAVVEHFAMQCEVPANALINAARAANLLLYPTPDGGLILSAPSNSAAVATLSYGQDFKHYELHDNFDLRFSEYVVKSFDYTGGAALKGAVKDGEFNFFRPMHIVADRTGRELGGCERRAELERNRRLAKAHALNLSVPGFHHAQGLYAINTQIKVVIPQEGIDQVFLIGERTFIQGEIGSVTQLQLLHRNAFLGEPRKKIRRASNIKKGAKR
jgi:prophage tail gpP-like protein